ncbi:MAG: serine/threonine-protein kinase [Archangium sp.]
MAELAPRFGRARGDLDAIVSRGRTQDYKGVMQNARLVLETLMRSLVAEDLGQTPGKATLEELVSKFRQKQNSGIVPHNVLAHMGTVQAWGNLSAHDHAGSLEESGVRVGREEVVASLNSMVAILTWYAEKKGLTAETAELATPASELEITAKRELTGRVIGGRYRLDARLAAGGMGEVYRATHLELGRALAIKLMRPELSRDASFVERFRREAMTASRLGHPHIVDIIDSGSEDGQFYFVMEFLDGETLTSLIGRGAAQLPLALELVTQIAEALDVAHRAGVAHRDLKPDNVIVLQRGGKPFIKLVDFGVAKVVTPIDQQLTTHGSVVGTPQYMSPEQAAGTTVDLRTDIYALGLILFELLTGQRPLVGETPALVMSAHISQTAPALPPNFPAALREFVARMLAKRPDDRPQTMANVLSTLTTLPRTAEKKLPLPLMGGVAVIGIALGVLVIMQPWKEATRPVAPPVVVPEVAKPVPPPEPAPVPVVVEPVIDAGVPVVPVVKKKPAQKQNPKAPSATPPSLLPADDL